MQRNPRCVGLYSTLKRASTGRYNNKCWTRDFCLTICPLLLQQGSRSDIDLVGTHLFEIAKRQKPNGKIPILYLDDEKKFLRSKIERVLEQKTMSFMLSRYLDDELENLTPHTRDSEVLFIIAVNQFVNQCPDSDKCKILVDSANLALNYVKTILSDGLIYGAAVYMERYQGGLE